MNSDMQRRALAARDAHEALLDLKRVVEEAHSVELEAVQLAVSSRRTDDISSKLRTVLEGMASESRRKWQQWDCPVCPATHDTHVARFPRR